MQTAARSGTHPRIVALFLVLGLLAVSQSGNIIRIGEAHPAAIAGWRLLIASLFFVLLAGRRLHTLRSLSGREKTLLVISAAVLSCHFLSWIAAVQMTTVAHAAIFFAFNPIFTAVAAMFFFNEKPDRRLWLSIVLGILGIIAIARDEVRLSVGNLGGDFMSLLSALLFSAYFILGKRLRRSLDSRVYVAALYGLSAIFCFAVLLLIGLPIISYNERTWICFFLMALFPTILGHTSFNVSLRYFSASRIATATLSEPLLAALVAYLAWDEQLTRGGWIGYGLICLSVVLLFSGRKTSIGNLDNIR